MEPEQAVILVGKLSNSGFGGADERKSFRNLAELASREVGEAGVGEYDGDEFGQGEARLFFYGPDADRLLDAILRGVSQFRFTKGSFAIKRYGPPGNSSHLVTVKLGR